jgi:hypothetical protein
MPDEAALKQNDAYRCSPRTGDRIMQFILELIWDLSRSSYLEALPQEKQS